MYEIEKYLFLCFSGKGPGEANLSGIHMREGDAREAMTPGDKKSKLFPPCGFIEVWAYTSKGSRKVNTIWVWDNRVPETVLADRNKHLLRKSHL